MNSNIHDFDNTGVSASSNGGSGFSVNLTSNRIASANNSVQTGVVYFLSQGLVTQNVISSGGQTGLTLENYFCCVSATGNTITGSVVGIFMGGTDVADVVNTVTHNSLFNNGTGIVVYDGGGGSEVIGSNAIIQSTTAAVNLSCSPHATVKHNAIFNAPVGIENIASGDTVSGNDFYSVAAQTATCP
jgi:hypothetical protein